MSNGQVLKKLLLVLLIFAASADIGQAGLIALHQADDDGTVHLFDKAGTNQGVWSPFSGDSVADIDFDPLTGDLYAFGDSNRLGIRYQDGSTSLLSVAPYTAPENQGGAIAISPLDEIALHTADDNGTVRLFDKAGTRKRDWVPFFGEPVADIDYDPLTGDLYAFGASNRLKILHQDQFDRQSLLSFGPIARENQGGDIAISPFDSDPLTGSVALHKADDDGTVTLFDKAGTRKWEWSPFFGDSVADIDYDPLTGDLYAFGESNRLMILHPDSRETLTDFFVPHALENQGGDIAVFTPPANPVPEPSSFAIPEPSSFAIFGIGGLGMLSTRRRRHKR